MNFETPDARGDRQLVEPHDVAFDGARDQAGDDHEGGDDHQALQQRPEAELGTSRHEADAVQARLDEVEPAERGDGHDQPQEEGDARLARAHPGGGSEQHAQDVDPETHQDQRHQQQGGGIDHLRRDAQGRHEDMSGAEHGQRGEHRRDQHRALEHVVEQVRGGGARVMQPQRARDRQCDQRRPR